MNELLETERAYVEELLCVLEASFCSFGGKKRKRKVLMICWYYFIYMISNSRAMQQRWTTRPWLPSSPAPCSARKTSCLATCLKSTSFIRGLLLSDTWIGEENKIFSYLGHLWVIGWEKLHQAFVCSFRTFLKELEAYTDYPELVGRCFLERVRTSYTHTSHILFWTYYV